MTSSEFWFLAISLPYDIASFCVLNNLVGFELNKNKNNKKTHKKIKNEYYFINKWIKTTKMKKII